jgi:hypothetical protein
MAVRQHVGTQGADVVPAGLDHEALEQVGSDRVAFIRIGYRHGNVGDAAACVNEDCLTDDDAGITIARDDGKAGLGAQMRRAAGSGGQPAQEARDAVGIVCSGYTKAYSR